MKKTLVKILRKMAHCHASKECTVTSDVTWAWSSRLWLTAGCWNEPT